ncbi:hypothetical protein FQR65_LT02512 [Abscondita terminalis]|nr:hypothetical protein FQR65_LT02512 [Abscondita terminalis]
MGKLLALSMYDLIQGLKNSKHNLLYKRAILSKLLKDHQVDFYWDIYNNCFKKCSDDVKLTLINKFKKGIFAYTSKIGLCNAMKSAYWFEKPGISNVRYPRTYNLAGADDPTEFIYDYHITACMSLIKFVLHHIQNKQINNVIHNEGTIPLQAYYFAIEELKRALRKFNHEDIDHYIGEAKSEDWDNFLENFYKLVHIGIRLKGDGGRRVVKKMQELAKPIITKIKDFWPTYGIDGMHNIWILKPINSCRGQGIHLCRTLEYIMRIVKLNPSKKYIIQKYIEKPLLIYDTKFDIRQWFLISSSNPLTIWIYKDAYIRFSSQLYSLYKLNESVHLTNNSIQSKYKNCSTRSKLLPVSNMWDTKQFRNYLCSIGKPDIYDRLIYPGMKQAITAAILMNQDALDKRKHSFELYGSDFMVTEDFRPWLIEINAHPALGPSTPVTARLAPLVQQDLIKVIVDRSRNPTAPVGRFELLYREPKFVQPVSTTPNFKLQGKKIQRPDHKMQKQALLSTATQLTVGKVPAIINEDKLPFPATIQPCLTKNVRATSSGIETALQSLLNWIQIECNKKTGLNNNAMEISTTESESDIDNVTNSDFSNNSLNPTSKVLYSKSDTFITKTNKIDDATNKIVFENVIQSMKNLAKAYQEYKIMCQVT